MTSLRRQLLTWLMPVYLVAAVAAVLSMYSMCGWMVTFFMDNQLRVFADSHAAAGGSTPALPALSAHNVEKGDLIVQIWDRNGRLLTTSWPELALSRQATDGFHDVAVGDHRWRVYTLQSPDRTVQTVQRADFRDEVIRSMALQAGVPVTLLIPISAVILWFAIRMALRRLELVAQAAAAQDERSLRELPVEHVPAEIRPLVLAVNTLLSRLRDAFASQRRFVQDAAHELRTPITAMTLQLENLRTRVTDRTAAEQVAQLEAGLARTRRLVGQLLRLARQEAPRNPDALLPLRLDALLKDVIADCMPIADRRRIDLGLAAGLPASVRANRDDLCSLFHNLLDNALRYTPEGGVVDVAMYEDAVAGAVTVEIVDSGPGVAPEFLSRVFDRFFRIEGSGAEGSGLGLAIARHAADRNGAGLELSNRSDGCGLIARVRFRNASFERGDPAAQGAAPLPSFPREREPIPLYDSFSSDVSAGPPLPRG